LDEAVSSAKARSDSLGAAHRRGKK